MSGLSPFGMDYQVDQLQHDIGIQATLRLLKLKMSLGETAKERQFNGENMSEPRYEWGWRMTWHPKPLNTGI